MVCYWSARSHHSAEPHSAHRSLCSFSLLSSIIKSLGLSRGLHCLDNPQFLWCLLLTHPLIYPLQSLFLIPGDWFLLLPTLAATLVESHNLLTLFQFSFCLCFTSSVSYSYRESVSVFCSRVSAPKFWNLAIIYCPKNITFLNYDKNNIYFNL